MVEAAGGVPGVRVDKDMALGKRYDLTRFGHRHRALRREAWTRSVDGISYSPYADRTMG